VALRRFNLNYGRSFVAFSLPEEQLSGRIVGRPENHKVRPPTGVAVCTDFEKALPIAYLTCSERAPRITARPQASRTLASLKANHA
jgi:hypothetical protein